MKECKLLYDVLANHLLWIETDKCDGAMADLRGSNLSGSDLSGYNLSGSDLSESDLSESDLSESDLSGSNLSGSDISWSNLSGSNLSGSNLSGSNLRCSDLRCSDLRWANISCSDLRWANLYGANLDFSSGIPFHCGGTNFVGDDHLAAQMIFHLTRGDWSKCSGGVRESIDHIRSMAITNLFCEYRDDIEEIDIED